MNMTAKYDYSVCIMISKWSYARCPDILTIIERERFPLLVCYFLYADALFQMCLFERNLNWTLFLAVNHIKVAIVKVCCNVFHIRHIYCRIIDVWGLLVQFEFIGLLLKAAFIYVLTYICFQMIVLANNHFIITFFFSNNAVQSKFTS